MNDTQDAINFLKISTHSHTGKHIYHTVEEIHNEIGAKCGIPALARNLRRHRSYGELLSRRREGKSYMEYSFAPIDELAWARPKPGKVYRVENYKLGIGHRIKEVNSKEGLSIWQRLKEIVGI